MSSTAKTVLIVAGAGVGVFVLLKVLSPPSLPRQPASSSAGTVQGLIGLGTSIGGALKGLFGGSSGKTGLSPGDQSIFDTVTDSSGRVDLSGVYDNSGIVDTLGG